MTDVNQAFAEIKRGAEEILVEEELLAKQAAKSREILDTKISSEYS